MRKALAVGLVLVAAPLVTAGAAGAGSKTPGRCCFTVSVDAFGHVKDTYQGTSAGQWTGSAEGDWGWSTRFVVSYTGRGVTVLGTQTMAQVNSDSAYSYDILLLPEPPATELRRDHRSCPAGFDPTQGIAPPHEHPLQPARTSQVIAAAQNVGGYARALVVTAPGHISFTCPWLTGDRVGKVDLNDPDAYVVRAPTTNNFLAGKSFGRSCWQNVEAKLSGPFPHEFSYTTVLGVQFTWFPRDQLPQKLGQLAAMKGKKPSLQHAVDHALDLAPSKPANSAGCE